MNWNRVICGVLGHRWKFKMKSVEGDTMYSCQRCRRVKNGGYVLDDYWD